MTLWVTETIGPRVRVTRHVRRRVSRNESLALRRRHEERKSEAEEYVQFDKEAWKVFIVYGSFAEPTTGRNFIVVRMPNERVPWSKKIAPSINKLVRPWFMSREEKQWYVDGESSVKIGDKRLWDTSTTIRYEWNGQVLKRIEAEE